MNDQARRPGWYRLRGGRTGHYVTAANTSLCGYLVEADAAWMPPYTDSNHYLLVHVANPHYQRCERRLAKESTP